MFELTLAMIFVPLALLLVWNLRKGIFSQTEVWKEKVILTTKESAVELQEDYKELTDKVIETKAKHDGKWFKMSDIEDLMK